MVLAGDAPVDEKIIRGDEDVGHLCKKFVLRGQPCPDSPAELREVLRGLEGEACGLAQLDQKAMLLPGGKVMVEELGGGLPFFAEQLCD